MLVFLFFVCPLVFSQSFGIWMMVDVVDQFGDPTGQKYVMTSHELEGRFSSDLVNGARMTALIAYSHNTGPTINISEFGRTPLMGFGNETITIAFQDRNKTNYTATGAIDRGMLFIHPDNREDVLSVLKAGGTVKFRIRVASPVDTSNYSFDIENADGFAEALLKVDI